MLGFINQLSFVIHGRKRFANTSTSCSMVGDLMLNLQRKNVSHSPSIRHTAEQKALINNLKHVEIYVYNTSSSHNDIWLGKTIIYRLT